MEKEEEKVDGEKEIRKRGEEKMIRISAQHTPNAEIPTTTIPSRISHARVPWPATFCSLISS